MLSTADDVVKARANVSRDLSSRIIGHSGVDPSAGRFKASFFVTEGSPYVGLLEEGQALIELRGNVNRAGAIVFETRDLDVIFDRWSARLEPMIELQARAKLGLAPDDLLVPDVLSKIAWNTQRTAEVAMWAEVAARVQNSPNQVGEVVLENSRFSRQGDGKFWLTTDPTKVSLDLDRLRKQTEDALEMEARRQAEEVQRKKLSAEERQRQLEQEKRGP